MFSVFATAGAAACERKLEALDCPCVSGYECCAIDNRCYPEGESCGRSSGSTGAAAGADAGGNGVSGSASGAAGEGDGPVTGASGAGGAPSDQGAAGERGEARGGASNEPATPGNTFPRFCSSSGWCGAKSGFRAAWSSGANDIWVASNDREVYASNSFSRWNGERWQSYDDGRDSWGRVLAIGGSGPDDVWFIGDDSVQARAFHWDGSQFSVMGLPASEIRGVWASARDDVWAVGVQGYALRYDGADWSSEFAPSFTHDLNAVWGSASDDVIAVGSNGAVARWDGDAWTVEREIEGVELTSIWGSGPHDVWAVGSDATVLHFDGEAWTVRDLGASDLAGAEFVAVTGTNEADVWIAERGGRLLHFDGEDFRVLTTSATGVAALAAAGERDVWAVGEQAFSARCEPSGCVEAGQLTSEDLFDVWGSATDDVWAVGANGVIAHFDGRVWQLAESPTTADLRAIHGAPGGRLWAVGDAVIRYDNGRWSLDGEAETAPLDAVFAFSDEDVWVAGAAATLRHFDGQGWDDFDTLGVETLTGLWGSASDDVWAVGVGDTNLRYDGSTWTKVGAPDGIDFSYQVVSGTSRDNVFVHGWYVQAGSPSFGEGRFDGQSWDFDGGDFGAALTTFGKPASWAVGPRAVWVLVGAAPGFGEIYRLGSNILPESPGTDVALYGVWGVSDEDIWVVGADGTVLEKEFTPEL